MKRNPRLSDIARQSANAAIYRLERRRVDRLAADTEILDSTAECLGFDADVGGYLIKTLSGRRIEGVESLTNSGLENGQRVALSGDDRSGYRIKAMPRG